MRRGSPASRRRPCDQRPRGDQPPDRVASCYFDSTPAVFITGQVNRNERKGPTDPPARLPGGGHRRDGHADHQGSLEDREARGGPRVSSALAFQLATFGAAGPGGHRPPDGHPAGRRSTCRRRAASSGLRNGRCGGVDCRGARGVARAALPRAERPLILAGGYLCFGGDRRSFPRPSSRPVRRPGRAIP